MTVYKINPANATQLFLADLNGGFTLFPGQGYNLYESFGKEIVEQSNQLRNAVRMGWVVKEEIVKKAPEPVVEEIVPVEEPEPESKEPEVTEAAPEMAESDQIQHLVDLAINMEVIEETTGGYQLLKESGKYWRFRDVDHIVTRCLASEEIVNRIQALLNDEG